MSTDTGDSGGNNRGTFRAGSMASLLFVNRRSGSRASNSMDGLRGNPPIACPHSRRPLISTHLPVRCYHKFFTPCFPIFPHFGASSRSPELRPRLGTGIKDNDLLSPALSVCSRHADRDPIAVSTSQPLPTDAVCRVRDPRCLHIPIPLRGALVQRRRPRGMHLRCDLMVAGALRCPIPLRGALVPRFGPLSCISRILCYWLYI